MSTIRVGPLSGSGLVATWRTDPMSDRLTLEVDLSMGWLRQQQQAGNDPVQAVLEALGRAMLASMPKPPIALGQTGKRRYDLEGS